MVISVSPRSLGSRCAAVWIAAALTLLAGPVQAAETPPPLEVGYSPALDLFNLLDNLPDWLPGYTASVYQQAWQRRFGLDDEDRALLAGYAAFRQRTSPLARDPVGEAPPADRLLAGPDTRSGDPYSRHFLKAASFAEGVEAALAGQSRKDRALLRQYYAHFVPRAQQLLAVRKPFSRQQHGLARQLAAPAVTRFAEEMKAFFKVDDPAAFRVRFIWWPDAQRTQAKLRGGYILLFSTFETDDDWAPIVMHEYSHFLSAGQAPKQKQGVAEAFAALCPGAMALPNPLNALEEPLAIYWGQYRFQQQVRGEALPLEAAWYIQPRADHAAKALAAAFPATGPAPRLEAGPLLEALASTCAESDPVRK